MIQVMPDRYLSDIDIIFNKSEVLVFSSDINGREEMIWKKPHWCNELTLLLWSIL